MKLTVLFCVSVCSDEIQRLPVQCPKWRIPRDGRRAAGHRGKRADGHGHGGAPWVREDQLHQQTADGAGKRVPLQQVPHPGPSHRNRRRPGIERDSSENLVPEPPDEAEKAHARDSVREVQLGGRRKRARRALRRRVARAGKSQ